MHLKSLMSFGSVAAAFVAVAALPNGAHAQGSAQVQAAIRSEESGNAEVRAFYQSHRGEPLWIRGSAPGPQAAKLLQLFESAQLDGLNPEAYRTRSLASTLSKARRGSPKALAAAEIQLSEAFAAYVRDSRKPRGKTEMLYAEKSLAPTVPTVASVLEAAAAAPNIVQYLESMGWMHPVYAQLRGALATSGGGKSAASPRAQLLRLNLERARILPGNPRMRHILVDAAGARLWLYENGRIRDTMKVVVGQPTQQTPMMAGLVRYAIANPYWYVPSDLAARRIAPNVLSGGPSYLRARRYEILSDWSANAKVVPPAKVNWRAVADGKQQLAMRQLPGGDNAMGKVKFMFPNDLG
ncbi:MAG TPA: L,D-transpeptidase family protein, partial [Allosphingosinicella sp.]|nr:L,D-transpeptidase family protein [Allosphingosinicella sp.]